MATFEYGLRGLLPALPVSCLGLADWRAFRTDNRCSDSTLKDVSDQPDAAASRDQYVDGIFHSFHFLRHLDVGACKFGLSSCSSLRGILQTDGAERRASRSCFLLLSTERLDGQDSRELGFLVVRLTCLVLQDGAVVENAAFLQRSGGFGRDRGSCVVDRAFALLS